MTTVVLVPNALDPSSAETHEVPALLPWLTQRFKRWPANGRIAHRVGKVEYDVTPACRGDVESLAKLDGTFVVRLCPAGLDPITGVGALIAGAVKLYQWIIPDLPQIKTPEQRLNQASRGSDNNNLGKRTNEARPDQRVPYIVGQVRSKPDLLSVPYTTYVDHVEHETAYLCVGVGPNILTEIRDGDTLISQIPGSSAQVYMPGKAPTGGPGFHEPDELTSVGDPIDDDVQTVYQVDSVNGQELFGFSDYTFYGSAFPQNDSFAVQNRFFYNGDGTGVISVPYNSDASEITDRVSVGDELFLSWPMANVPPGGSGTAPDLGTPVTSAPGHPVTVESLTVTAIDDTDDDIHLVHITVAIPATQQAEWALLETYFEPIQDPGGIFTYVGASFPYAQVTPLTNLYAGPFFIDFEHPAGSTEFEVVCNFVAPRGLVQDDGVTARALYVECQVILTPVDENNTPTGDPEAFQGTLEGSATARGQRALTLRCKPTGFDGVTRCRVQARRLTNSPRRQRQLDEVEENLYGADLDADPPRLAHFSGQVSDEVRWTHCYSMSKPPNISFGDVTTIHVRTVATAGALRVATREITCLAYRSIPIWNGTSFVAPAPNNSAEQILFAVMRDPMIGDLPEANIDFDGIVAAMEAVRASVWSPTDMATSFNYTFDETEISFEETLQTICQAVFCTPFRRGNVVSVRTELAGDDSALVFNHRNILKGSQRITHTLGKPIENDSIEVGFVDPADKINNKVLVPKFGSRLKPRRLNIVGLANPQQALWHAYRALHKMRYQRQNMQLEATAEAATLGVRQRVLVADGTRSNTQAGEITGFDGANTVRTSQPCVLQGGKSYTLYLQRSDGTVDEHVVDSCPTPHRLVLATSPDPIVDDAEGVPTGYVLAADDEATPRAYLIASVRPMSPLEHQVDAVNYSHMYYLADGLTTWVDFANGLNDLSPEQREFDRVGGIINGGLWTGGVGDQIDVRESDVPDTTTPNYTKAVWINATGTPSHSGLIQNDVNSDEEFAITFDETLVASHDGDVLSFDYSPFIGSEHMVAVSYDSGTERLALFIDGALVDEKTVEPPPPGNTQRYLEDFEGTCRMMLRWGRALSDREIMEIYLRTRA